MSVRIAPQKRSAVFIDLGLMAYGRALALQQETVQSKIRDRSVQDRLYFVEHPRVYTLGKRGGRENLTVSASFLKDQDIGIVETDRGGNITYHGPGQAVLYPIIDLEKNRIAVKDFVYGLEEIMKRTAMDFGLSVDRDRRNHGVWIQNAKIGSVGIAVKKGIAFHGIAMNISNDLTPFQWIHPCGLSNVSITSVKQALPEKDPVPLMSAVKNSFRQHFCDIFTYAMIPDDQAAFQVRK